jgi:dipeptidyl aminopeptidase/acylaminoacyl peptidase
VAQELAKAGFVTASFEYRTLTDAGHVDHAIDDTAEMLAWWAQQAERFWFDPARTAVVGLSAGAALAFLGLARHPIAQRVVSVYGVTDWSIVPGAATTLPHRLLWGGPRPHDWRERSPLHIFQQGVPVLLMHGTADRVVVPAHSERMAEDRRARGLPVDLRLYPGEGHGFLRDPKHPGHATIAGFLRG